MTSEKVGYQFVLVSMADGVGTLTLNRPDRLNAVDAEMARELVEAATELLSSKEVRALVITGAGRAFSAGGDITFLEESLNQAKYADAMSLVRAGGKLVRLIRDTPKPVLASVNGVAAGGGANLALACDLRIASDTAGIGQVFHKIGLHPDWGGTYFLPRLVGPARALELIWSAEVIPAARCLELGLVNRIVPAAELAAATAELAARLAALPPLAASLAKKSVYRNLESDLPAALSLEEDHQEKCFKSKDALEGFSAFTAKRPPHFEGE
jgi:2-(1,2-epoxy-1,2-dihydrophenyl)acetyl-CoA isomerase